MRSGRGAAAVAWLVLLAACSSGATETAETSSPTVRPSTATEASIREEPATKSPFPLWGYEMGDAAPVALLEGVLRIDGKCVYVESSELRKTFLAILPAAGTSWSTASSTLTVFGEEFTDGTRVGASGFGREGRPNVPIADPVLVQQPSEQCDATNIWFTTLLRRPDR